MKCYSTKGIQERMPFYLQLVCLEMYRERKAQGSQDYFHIFELSTTPDGKQQIHHRQEQPPYEKMVEIERDESIDLKVWLIEEADHVIFLLPSEY